MAKAKGQFKCAACGRSFSMAAHLGRHMSTMHAPKGKRKAQKAAAKRAARQVTATRSTPGAHARLIRDLQACRDEAAAQVAALDQVLVTLSARR